MNIKDFVKNYNELTSADLKNACVKKIIKRTYCPLLTKKEVLEAMVNKSSVNGKTKYVDMVLSKLNFTMIVIALYTDLELDKDEQGVAKAFEAYDMLTEFGIINLIYEAIGEREINELLSINAAALDTWHEQNTSTKALLVDGIDNVIQKIGATSSASIHQLSEILNDEEKMNKAIKALEKVINKVTK